MSRLAPCKPPTWIEIISPAFHHRKHDGKKWTPLWLSGVLKSEIPKSLWLSIVENLCKCREWGFMIYNPWRIRMYARLMASHLPSIYPIHVSINLPLTWILWVISVWTSIQHHPSNPQQPYVSENIQVQEAGGAEEGGVVVVSLLWIWVEHGIGDRHHHTTHS